VTAVAVFRNPNTIPLYLTTDLLYSNSCNLRIYVRERGADVELPDGDMEMSKHVGVLTVSRDKY